MICINLEIDEVPKMDGDEAVLFISYRKCYAMWMEDESKQLGIGKPLDKYYLEITKEQYEQLEETDSDIDIEEGYFVKRLETTDAVYTSIGFVKDYDIDSEYGDGLTDIMEEYENEIDKDGFVNLKMIDDSINMDDVDSVNRYLELTYGIDDYNPLYILTDGRGLDSETKYGVRGRDHHLTYDKNSYTLENLLKMGAIRCMPESPGISISVYPNQVQQRTLFRWIRHFANENFYIDFHDENGNDVNCTIEIPHLNVELFIDRFDSIFQKGMNKLHEETEDDYDEGYYEESVKRPIARMTENKFAEIITEAIKRRFNII